MICCPVCYTAPDVDVKSCSCNRLLYIGSFYAKDAEWRFYPYVHHASLRLKSDGSLIVSVRGTSAVVAEADRAQVVNGFIKLARTDQVMNA